MDFQSSGKVLKDDKETQNGVPSAGKEIKTLTGMRYFLSPIVNSQ